MRRLNLIFQEILKFVLIYLFLFIWIRYFVRNLLFAVVISLFSSLASYLVLLLFNKKKKTQSGLKLKEKEDAENMFLSLACQNNPMDFFVKLSSKKHKSIEKHKTYLTINHEKEKVKTLLYFDSSFEGLNVARFMEIYNKVKKEKASKIVIVCKTISDKQLFSFSLNFKEKFLFLDEYESYQKLYKFYGCFPEITNSYKKEKKLVFKDFLAYSFNKKRTKGYLFSAFILVLSSLFVRATIYYCIVASLLVVFALVSQFNPYFNVKNDTEIL